MSINFSTLQGLTIPEGVVTQITDASGVVLWTSSKPVVLEVAKQTLTTYAGETSYADESFVLLDIFPKNANSTVRVTYGDLTKTLTFSGTNSQQVYFGTFNGVVDETETPSSGTLTIEGGYGTFVAGSYQSNSKGTINICGCITNVIDWGTVSSVSAGMFENCASLALASLPDRITYIGTTAFKGCTNLALTSLPSGITSIGSYAFYGCTNITLSELPSGITSIGSYAFYGCTNLALTSLPSGITSIGSYAFSSCSGLTNITLPSGITSIGSYAFSSCSGLTNITLPSGLTSIGEATFYQCSGITSIDLPSALVSIGMNAFWYCTSLVSVTFGNTVGWYVTETVDAETGINLDVSNATTNATYLRNENYRTYYWYRAT